MATVAYKDLLQQRRDAGYEMFPVGTYDVKVVDAEVPQKGNSMGFIVQLEVLNGPHAGRKFKHWMTLSETVIAQYPGLLDMWFREMAAFGLGDAFFESEPSNEQTIAALKGRTARAQVGRRTKKGTDEEVENTKILPPATPMAPVAAPAPDPMAMTATPSAPAADPTAPNLPPF